MTGATSTTGGGGGAAARTLPLLQPRAWRRRLALTKAVDICFIISFPLNRACLTSTSIASLARLNRDAARLGGNAVRESSSRFRRVSHAIASSPKGNSHTRTDAKLSHAKSKKSPGSAAQEVSKWSKVSRRPV